MSPRERYSFSYPNYIQCIQFPLLVATDLCEHARESTCMGGCFFTLTKDKYSRVTALLCSIEQINFKTSPCKPPRLDYRVKPRYSILSFFPTKFYTATKNAVIQIQQNCLNFIYNLKHVNIIYCLLSMSLTFATFSVDMQIL